MTDETTGAQAPTPGPLSASDIAHVRDYWSAICDSDWHLIPANIRDDLEERLAAVGLAEWRAVTDDDLEDTFAYERGIEKGRSCLDLTALGHLAFKSDADGWMPWSGGENPVPGQKVNLRWLGTQSDDSATWDSDLQEWEKQGAAFDIIAFRLAPTTPVEASGSLDETVTEVAVSTIRWALGRGDDLRDYKEPLEHVLTAALSPQPSGETRPTDEEIRSAIKATEYKYFGDYEFTKDQHDAVDILVRAAQALLSARPLALGGQKGEGEAEQ